MNDNPNHKRGFGYVTFKYQDAVERVSEGIGLKFATRHSKKRSDDPISHVCSCV